MKAKTAVIAGLVASTTTVPAQDIALQLPHNAGIRNLVAQVTIPSIVWTNRISFHSIERPSFDKDFSIRSAPGRTAQSDRLSMKSNYQVIVLPLGDVVPTATTDEVKRVVSTENNAPASVLHFTEEELLYLQYGMPRELQTMQKEETGKKKPVQHLYIKPLSAPRRAALNSYKFSEFIMVDSPSKLTWNEWLNPRVFIPKWAEMWMTESDATPVVLVLTTF